MTKQEIITLLIKDYEQAIKRCRWRLFKNIHKYLNEENMGIGVCFAAIRRHDMDIYYSEWVKKHGDYWARTPSSCYTKEEIIRSLQTRLSILKAELEIPE